ncbi:Crp/Fnr family transcriptional regulator [Reichenbachiella agarivorans]|uniref:Crp/Fnr family transcriptional regulator n=1 Tax=Reichenbachiella agarivorans TaxID=2979464 RepID=A0ABY6CQD6_9BACT|nr:Crp/Fnr family transcriptional regulator [Reichenbachiella agarivorans]UXP32717.1 Crp/Fnr family transcriptional regulator [Reichenbachiella agarivorans]
MTEIEHLKQQIFRLSPLSEDEWEDFSVRWTPFSLKKGEYMIAEGKIEKYFYFIHSGVLRAFFRKDGHESNIGFTYDGDYSGAYDSFLDQKVADWNIEALSDVVGLRISYVDLMAMYDAYKSVERWGRLFNAKILIGMGRRQVEIRDFSAEERFERLMRDSPHIFQLVPQKHLASYLGMAPETFSRMRKSSMTKTD